MADNLLLSKMVRQPVRFLDKRPRGGTDDKPEAGH